MSVSVSPRTLQGATEFPIAQEQKRLDRSQAGEVVELSAPVRRLDSGEVLFRAGDRKSGLYRVESGALCLYQPHSGEHRGVVEFAFAGDWLGLGYLEHHTRSARAIGETQVTCLPTDAIDRLVEASPRAQDQLNRAIEDELEFVRDRLVRSGQRDPIARVAAFLVALSHANRYEGRAPNIITDSVTSGIVASYLALSVEALARVLVELRARGLIETCPPLGLRLNDIHALEHLADGCEASVPRAQPDESTTVECSQGL